MPTRRTFFKSAAAGLAAGALSSCVSARETTNPQPVVRSSSRPGFGASGTALPRARVRKALKDYMYAKLPGTTLEKFKVLKEMGFEGVELGSPVGDIAEFREASEKSGLVIDGLVLSTHWGQPFSSNDPAQRAASVKALETSLRNARELGADSVLVVPAVVSKQVSYAQAWDRSLEEIRKVLPVVEETGVRIALENVWNRFLLSPLEAARYVDEFNHPLVGWHFDTGNIVRDGFPEQWIRILGPRVFKLDIKEFSTKKMDAEGPSKGFAVNLLDGTTDWKAVMEALAEVGFDGWGTSEMASGDAAYLADHSRRMDKIFAS